jgi:hypothetical protein
MAPQVKSLIGQFGKAFGSGVSKEQPVKFNTKDQLNKTART